MLYPAIHGVSERNNPFRWASALQAGSRNCSPAPDLALWRPIFQNRFFSGGALFPQTLVSSTLRSLLTPAQRLIITKQDSLLLPVTYRLAVSAMISSCVHVDLRCCSRAEVMQTCWIHRVSVLKYSSAWMSTMAWAVYLLNCWFCYDSRCSWLFALGGYVYIYIYIHTYIHTYVYIYIYMYI